MTRLVQFLHPGPEHGPDRDSSSLKTWNQAKHKRKFLQASGKYTNSTSDKPQAGTFVFWGEWEPQSHVSELGTIGVGAKWLHRPFLDLAAVRAENPNGALQNTDPMVFGDYFQYGVCRQFNARSQSATKMASLENGDIILFGSHVDGAFALDTVFVVGDYAPLKAGEVLPSQASKLYRQVTIDVIQIPQCGLRLYCSKGWSSDEPFSFVPCIPLEGKPKSFDRPRIRPEGLLLDLITPKMKQNFKVSNLRGAIAAAEVWRSM